jgi:hypothetical protein
MEFASFKTIEEVNAVISMTKNVINFDWFLIDGISLKSKSPTEWYSTETGEKIDYVIPWLSGQPDGAGGAEFYLVLGKFPKTGPIGFNDAPASGYAHLALCQRNI